MSRPDGVSEFCFSFLFVSLQRIQILIPIITHTDIMPMKVSNAKVRLSSMNRIIIRIKPFLFNWKSINLLMKTFISHSAKNEFNFQQCEFFTTAKINAFSLFFHSFQSVPLLSRESKAFMDLSGRFSIPSSAFDLYAAIE